MLLRFDPFRELDRAFDQLADAGTRPMVPFDAVRRGDHVVVSFDLPGVRADDIDLTVERDVLTLTAERRIERQENDEVLVAERRAGHSIRRLLLGENLDTEHLSAEHRDGVLTVTIPVAERAKPRRVHVAIGGSEASAIEATSAES